MLDHGQHHGGANHMPGCDLHDQESWPFDTTRRDREMGVMAMMAVSSENTEGTGDTEQVCVRVESLPQTKAQRASTN